MTTTRPPDTTQDSRPETVDSHQASQRLGITEDAIRKRIARGTLEGYKEDGRWWVQIPDNGQNNNQSQPETDRTDGKDIAIATMEARITSLERQLEAREREVGQLHHLLAQTALSAAPARPWWRFW